MAADVAAVHGPRPHVELIIHMVPGSDELLLIYELWLDELGEGDGGLEVYLLLLVALVGDLDAETASLEAAAREVHLKQETGVVFELIVHDLRGTDLQLCLLRLRTVDDDIDIVEVDCAFVGHPDLASHWVSIVASHAVLTCHVELEALKHDCAFLGQAASQELVVGVHSGGDELLAVLGRDEGLLELLRSSSSGQVQGIVLDCEV